MNSTSRIDSLEYALTKVNLAYFQPSLLARAEELFLNIKRVKKRFRDDFNFQDLNAASRIRGDSKIFELSKSGPVIFVSFHMGPMGPLLSYISRNEIDLLLLLDRFHFERGADRYFSIYQKYIEEKGRLHHFNVLNAEGDKIGTELSKVLRNGSSLLLFVDGNTGIGGVERRDEKLCVVNFLHKKILARRGAAYFSWLFNRPIIPVMSYVEKSDGVEGNFLEFLDPILPDKSIPKNQFIEQVTQQLFSILERFVQKYPDQWEGWLYVNNFLDRENVSDNQVQVDIADTVLPLRFNDERFGFASQNEKYFLLDRIKCQPYLITSDVYHFLAGLQTPRVIESVNANSVVHLLKKGILVKS